MRNLPVIRVGTRASLLARTQTEWVAEKLRGLGQTVTIETISTAGDQRGDVPVPRIGGDGVFVRELESALLAGRIDAAVHSLKDLPTAETPGLALACVPHRAMPFDVLVCREHASLASLPPKAVIGTSSVRRVMQVRFLRPELVVRGVRGNVDSRLKRLDDGEYDGLILAGAGLERLGLSARVTEILRPDAFWPAVAQGAIVIQTRADDVAARMAIAPLEDAEARLAVTAERSFLASLAGGCLAPIAAWARRNPRGNLDLGACVLAERGSLVQRIACEKSAAPGQSPQELGVAVAAELRLGGADTMLADVRGAANEKA